MGTSSNASAQNGCEAEFEAIFLEHFPRVVGILMCLVGERSKAEDLGNEIFWKLYRSKRAFVLDGNVAGWLYRAATRAGIDAIRAAARRSRYEKAASAVEQDGAPAHGSQLENLLRAEERAKVQGVLSSMKPARAQIILMRANGASYKELATAMDVGVSSIGTLLNRAEAEFRSRYLKLLEKEKGI